MSTSLNRDAVDGRRLFDVTLYSMADIGVKVDDRIQLAESRGSVRYIGPIQNREGLWVGIEWDDEHRGKHNGVVNNHRYFETKGDAPSGSFVPAERFRLGYDLVTALRTRYDDENAYDEEDMFVSTTSNKSKRIELVGLTKIENYQKNTQHLRSVDLSGSCISLAGPLEALRKLLSNLEELNVGFNLIRSWQTVVDLFASLPHLTVLNLSGNPFLEEDVYMPVPTADGPVLSSQIKTLILNECKMKWEQAVSVASWLPHLAGIQVCTNAISVLSPPEKGALMCLEAIDFSFNQLKEWSEVCHLSHLPCLKRLNLTGNPLTSVFYAHGDVTFFQSLESLLLGDCAIHSWNSVAALNLFPSLKESRLTGNPLMQSIVGGGRYEIVGRVGGLVHLNGSRVPPQERKDCERRYVSHVANYCLQNDVDMASITQLHPRYPELIAKHGEPTTNASVAKQTGALRENVIEITLTCHAASGKMGEQTKKVSINMTLGTLKTLIEKLFVLPRNKMKLYLKADDRTFPEDITDIKDDKRLGDLYIIDGQQILVNE